MENIIFIKGKKITPADIHIIKPLLVDYSSWNRTELSYEINNKLAYLENPVHNVPSKVTLVETTELSIIELQ